MNTINFFLHSFVYAKDNEVFVEYYTGMEQLNHRINTII